MSCLGGNVRNKLELDRIQGNVVPGFNKDHQAFVLVHFPDSHAGRSWLNRLRHSDVWEVTSAAEVDTFRQLQRLAATRRPDEEWTLISATWLNIAFSFSGLKMLLGAYPEGIFSGDLNIEQFRDNRFGHASAGEQLDVHALLILAADRPEDLANEVVRQEARLAEYGITVMANLQGNRLPGSVEHFGYRDGISQPNIEGSPDSTATQPLIKPGEFLLGYVDEAGHTSSDELGITRNGSYLAFLRFRQEVAGFRDALRTARRGTGLSADEFGAEIIGRWQDGEELGGAQRRFSHIGRAHPDAVEVEPDSPDRHRLIRRGIPYGPKLPADSPDDGQDRGLLFLAYQADLHRQFEHVWSRWLRSPDFPVSGAGEDPLTGSASVREQNRVVLIPRADGKGGTARVRLPQFVALEYGGYFFTPSIPALWRLCGESTVPLIAETNSNMPTIASNSVVIPTNHTGGLDFVKLVYDQNPYDIKEIGTLPNGKAELDGPAQQYGTGNPYPNARSLTTYLASAAYTAGTALGGNDLEKFPYWTFNGEQIRISKSMRITYTWTGAPPTFTGYILIGYAGPVWP